VVTPEYRRTAITCAIKTVELTDRHACCYTGFARSSQRYHTRWTHRSELRERLHTLALVRSRWGDRRLFELGDFQTARHESASSVSARKTVIDTHP
jgi:hypothetical protein